MSLTSENYSKGFLIDEELMGGVTQKPDEPETFVAFVLRHTTGEYLGYQPFTTLDAALGAINSVQRDWVFDKVGGCGNGNCGNGSCKGGGCGLKAKGTDAPEAGSCSTGQCPT